jgi:integrase
MRVYREKYIDRKGQEKTANRWYIDFTDHLNRRHKLSAFTDKRQSDALAQQILGLVAAKAGTGLTVEQQKWINTVPTALLKKFTQWGLIDNCRVEGGKPLKEHIEDWKISLQNSGVSERFIFQMYGAVKKHFMECGFVYFNDISASKLQLNISKLKRTVRKRDEKTKKLTETELGEATAATKNYHLRYCKQFCKWLLQDGRVIQNPLEHLKKITDTGGKKRAAYTAEELRTLLAYTATAETIFGVKGYDRHILYRFAAETGFRASEIASMQVKDFDFTNNLVTLSGTHTKNGKEAMIPLKPETAKTLQKYFAGKLSNVKVFKMPHIGNLAAMFKKDLKGAKITIDADRGKTDFHALRHTFCSMLASSGVHPKTAQELMRHSDINLTMSRYTHTFRGQTATAINTLPDLGKLPESQKQVKTGTDDNFVSSVSSDKPCIQNGIKPDTTGILDGKENAKKVLSNSEIYALYTQNTKAGEEIRTLDFQLGKLTLYH